MRPIVVLDPGHGGGDPGAVAHDLREKDVVLKLGLLVRDELSAYEVDVRMTREKDEFVELNDRAAFANRLKAALFVSLHCNAGGGQGFESYVYTNVDNTTVAIQNVIHGEAMAYLRGFNIIDRGKKRANFAVLRETIMPAILLENLFIDNARENKLLRDESFLRGLAKANASGIAKALGLKAKKLNAPKEDSDDVSPWAREAVEWVKKEGLMSGYPDGTFRGKQPVTREELAAVLYKMLKK